MAEDMNHLANLREEAKLKEANNIREAFLHSFISSKNGSSDSMEIVTIDDDDEESVNTPNQKLIHNNNNSESDVEGENLD